MTTYLILGLVKRFSHGATSKTGHLAWIFALGLMFAFDYLPIEPSDDLFPLPLSRNPWL